MKIAHLASYHVNIGDSITIRNIRRSLEAMSSKHQWIDVNMKDFLDLRNNVEYCIKQFKEINSKCDAILIGGGGLIEGGNHNKMGTRWKIPINDEVLSHIDIPIYVHSIGFNYFWGQERLTQEGRTQMKSLVERAKAFSLRDDGSYDIMEGYGFGTDRVVETPDPGMMMDSFLIHKRKSKLKLGVFQPAWNSNAKINEERFGYKQNINSIVEFADKQNLACMSHTIKDRSFPMKRWFRPYDNGQLQKMMNYRYFMELVKDYLKVDYVIAMRGHGQIMSIGMNIPGIYIVTQPKVLGLSRKADLLDYTVNVRDEGWLRQLERCAERLLHDPSYLDAWYVKRDQFVAQQRLKYNAFNKRIAKCL